MEQVLSDNEDVPQEASLMPQAQEIELKAPKVQSVSLATSVASYLKTQSGKRLLDDAAKRASLESTS